MGKPLIADGQMLAMHDTMLHLRGVAADSSNGSHANATGHSLQPDVALLAATLLQLRPGDVLVTEGDSSVPAEVLTHARQGAFIAEHRATHVPVSQGTAALFAAGHAYAQLRTARPGDDAPVTVALVPPDPYALNEAMWLASEGVLPLVLVVQDGLVARAPTFQSIANVEVIRVDAADAVACCRVMQESLLRTRNRWGCVVLHAVHLPAGADPVIAVEAHLRRRGLQF